ncbi:uncharacterized protein ISCGN_003324 [Ixodes scapularis]
MCTADPHTDDSGCVGSIRTTHGPVMVNALGRSTSTCDDLRAPVPAYRRESRLPSPRRAAAPGSGVAEDDRRQDPPGTSEGPHSNATRDRNDAPATVKNNQNNVIDGHDASALVDTGAEYSVLSGRLSQRLRKVTTPWDGPQLRTAGGHLITPVGRCTACVEIHGETCPVKFVVLRDCARDVILGMDFFCEYSAVIDLETNKLRLRKPVVMTENQKTAPATSTTVRVLSDHVNLPPCSSVLVPVATEKGICGEALLEGSVQLLLGRGIGVARGIAELQDGRTVALVTNFRQKAQHLTKGTAVGHAEELPDSAAITGVSEDLPSWPQDTMPPSLFDIDPTLPTLQRRQLSDLLAEFRETIKSRFSNLRSQFNREHKKVKCSEKSGTGTEGVYVPRWIHYREMLLLQSACPQHGSRIRISTRWTTTALGGTWRAVTLSIPQVWTWRMRPAAKGRVRGPAKGPARVVLLVAPMDPALKRRAPEGVAIKARS